MVLPTIADGERPAMVGSRSVLGPAQEAAHASARSVEFIWPQLRRLLGRLVAVAAPGPAASSSDNRSLKWTQSRAIEPPGLSLRQAAPGRRSLPEPRAV